LRLAFELLVWVAAAIFGIVSLLIWSLALSPGGGSHFGIGYLGFVPVIATLMLAALALTLSWPRIRDWRRN